MFPNTGVELIIFFISKFSQRSFRVFSVVYGQVLTTNMNHLVYTSGK